MKPEASLHHAHHHTPRELDKLINRLLLQPLHIPMRPVLRVIRLRMSGLHLQHLPLIGDAIDRTFPRFILDGLNVSFYFGGTLLLIVVGVAMDTINQIEAQLIMRHYEGFTPRSGRVRRRGRIGA